MAVGETESRRGAYFGVGCLTGVGGFFGGAMIAVLIAKIIGALRGCTPEPETGAPCGWFIFAVCGSLIGLVTVPTVAISRMRSSEKRSAVSGNSETG